MKEKFYLNAFADSGAFISALDKADTYYDIFSNLFLEPPRKIITSYAIIFETHSWFLHKLGETYSIKFLNFIRELKPLKICPIEKSVFESASKYLDKYRGLKLTLVDAFSLVLIKRYKIENIWALDHHLVLEGGKLPI